MIPNQHGCAKKRELDRWSTKIHAIFDIQDHLIDFYLTKGKDHDLERDHLVKADGGKMRNLLTKDIFR
ncbi:hypothetical protein HE1_00051 [Holospora elegans E1]|uniref:Uncharacterized protein n=1 Tax=Holospora elegans E1 TaxID=1427503 RepID=A0A023DX21_9PROT|nr:hypothetical protein HE1_00051 [Holospora elegans E1]